MSVCDITSHKAKESIESVLDYLEQNIEKLYDGSKESNDMLKKCNLMMANYEAGIIDGLIAFGSELRGGMNMDELANGEDSLRSQPLWKAAKEGKLFRGLANSFREFLDKNFVGISNKFGHTFSHTKDGAAKFLEAVGYDKLMNGKAKADQKIANVHKALAVLQKKMSKSSRQVVFGESGNIKSGVMAFLLKQDPENPGNFESRVRSIIESTELQKQQKKGTNEDLKSARLTVESLQALGVINENGDILIKDRQSFKDNIKALEKSGALDRGHMQVVKFFQDQFSELLPQHQEISQGVYNHVLLPQNDYVPDYTVKTGVSKTKDRASGRAISTDRVMDNPLRSPDDKASNNPRSKSLQDQQQGKSPSQGGFRYDFDFMGNMMSKLEDGYLDIHTADAVRQINSAVNSESFETIFRNPTSAEIARKRLVGTVDAVRGVNNSGFGQTSKLVGILNKVANTIAEISVFRALGTLKQPLQQFIPAIAKVVVMSEMGGPKAMARAVKYSVQMGISWLNPSADSGLSPGKIKLLNERSDAQYRGVKSSADMDSSSQKEFPESLVGKFGKATYGEWRKLQQRYLEAMLVSPDKTAARVSWLIHYEDFITRSTGKEVDWEAEASSNSKLTRQASAYANQMVNASLNETYQEAMGGVFSSKDDIVQALRKIFIPFGSMQSSLRINMISDLSVIFATGERKSMMQEGAQKKAAKRLAGTLAEQAAFIFLKVQFAKLQYKVLEPLIAQMAGYAYFEKDEEREDQIRKQLIQQAYTDLLPHLPLTDNLSILAINTLAKEGHMDWLLEEINEEMYDPVETPFFGVKEGMDLGVYAVAIDDANVFGEMLRGALTGNISKDGPFFTGEGRELSLREQEDCLNFVILYAISGAATPQTGTATIEKLFKKIKYQRENNPRTNKVLEFDQIDLDSMSLDSLD
tara:strand:- start:1559 stop:4330 length:2772 start_codon:yes stop_codon:yes gene_type:complete